MENLSKLQNHEYIYSSIISFYNLAEDLISTVEDDMNDDFPKNLDLIEPLVENLEEATDILVNYYRDFVKSNRRPNFFAKKKIEKAVDNIQDVIIKCEEMIEAKKRISDF